MITHILKWHFILVVRALFVALSLLSTASHGQGEKNGAPLPTPSTIGSDIKPPSVEQTLVPESVFAMQLAEALKLGPVPDAAKAEELLSGLGIEPKNGWIAEYPVTPEVLGDVEKGISMASDQGKIALTKDQALKLFSDVKARLGFDVKPGPNPSAGLIKKPGKRTVYIYTDTDGVTHFTDDHDSIPEENQKNTKIITQSTLHEPSGGAGGGTTQAPGPQYKPKPTPEAINNHYDDQGPPAVTYYSPPEAYSYLYSWVPYPFWSTGLYFPGFFVLNDFHRHVFVNRHPYFVTHHHGSGSDFSRSLSPSLVNRGLQGQLKPDGMNHSRGFSTPNAQAGARAIVEHNPNRNGLTNGTSDSRMDTSRKPFSSAGNSETFGNTPVVPNGRIMMPNDMYRPITPYSGNMPVVPGGRIQMNNDLYRPTPYSSGFQRGGSNEGFQGNGNFSGHGGGGFSGGVSKGGGHR
jgi:hypothetical protein